MKIDVDRTLAQQMKLNQQNAADSLLVALNSSARSSPNFWLDPQNNVSYPLVVQTPTYRIKSMQDLRTRAADRRRPDKSGPTADERRRLQPRQGRRWSCRS